MGWGCTKRDSPVQKETTPALGVPFFTLSNKLMDLYERLAEILEVSDLNIDKANRRTLLKYAKRTKFQRRREAFYSVCEEGTKSKVAICKSEKRPTWVHNLETLKTKQLRVQLNGFLKELGILENPKYANLEKLAKEKRWHAVIYMDDENKSGGTIGEFSSPHRGPRQHDAPNLGVGGGAGVGYMQEQAQEQGRVL